MDDGCLGARACLDAIKPAYEAALQAKVPVGIGLGLKNSGLGNEFDEMESSGPLLRKWNRRSTPAGPKWVRVYNVALQVAVEELGVSADQVKVIVDSTRELGAGQTTGSRGTLMGAGQCKTPAG